VRRISQRQHATAHVFARELPPQRERGPRRDRTQGAQAAIEGALELAPERVVVEREDALRVGIGQRPYDRTVAVGERQERERPAGQEALTCGGLVIAFGGDEDRKSVVEGKGEGHGM